MRPSALALRSIAALMLLSSFGLGFLLFTQLNLATSFMSQRYAEQYEERTRFLARNMAGGIAWNKPESIVNAYSDYAAPQEPSELIALLATDTNRRPVSSFASDLHESVDLAAILSEQEAALGETEVITLNEATHVTTLVAVQSKRGPAGFVAMAWSKQAAAGSVSKLQNLFHLQCIAISLIVIVSLAILLFKPQSSNRLPQSQLAVWDNA